MIMCTGLRTLGCRKGRLMNLLKIRKPWIYDMKKLQERELPDIPPPELLLLLLPIERVRQESK